MIYAPHILQKMVVPVETQDEWGRPVVADPTTQWRDICRCRCDNGGLREVRAEDGNIAVPEYHIVLEGRTPDVRLSDRVRCVTRDGEVKCEGRVIRMNVLNRLDYAEIYV